MAPELPAGLVDHIDRVVTLAGQLAVAHDLDDGATTRLLLTAQGHDVLRSLDDAELLRRAAEQAIKLDPVERAEPVLLHGPLGALELRERFELDDERVLHAIRWHSSGHPDYDAEAWAFFVADKVEPEKLRAWPELQRPLDLARSSGERSLERAALAYLDLSFQRGEREGWTPHPMALRTRDALLARGIGRA